MLEYDIKAFVTVLQKRGSHATHVFFQSHVHGDRSGQMDSTKDSGGLISCLNNTEGTIDGRCQTVCICTVSSMRNHAHKLAGASLGPDVGTSQRIAFAGMHMQCMTHISESCTPR